MIVPDVFVNVTCIHCKLYFKIQLLQQSSRLHSAGIGCPKTLAIVSVVFENVIWIHVKLYFSCKMLFLAKVLKCIHFKLYFGFLQQSGLLSAQYKEQGLVVPRH